MAYSSIIIPPFPRSQHGIPGHLSRLMNMAGTARVLRRIEESAYVLERGLLEARQEKGAIAYCPVLVIQLMALYRDHRELLIRRDQQALSPVQQDQIDNIFQIARDSVQLIRSEGTTEERTKLSRCGFDGVAALSSAIEELATEFEATIRPSTPAALPGPIVPPVQPPQPTAPAPIAAPRPAPLEIKPPSSLVLLSSARGMLAAKRYKEALISLLQAREIEPENAAVQTELNTCADGFLIDAERELYKERPNIKAVETFLERYRSATPTDPSLQKRYGVAIGQLKALKRKNAPEEPLSAAPIKAPPPPAPMPTLASSAVKDAPPPPAPRPTLTHDERSKLQQVRRLLREADTESSNPNRALVVLLAARTIVPDHLHVNTELDRLFDSFKAIALKEGRDRQATIHACKQALRIRPDTEIATVLRRAEIDKASTPTPAASTKARRSYTKRKPPVETPAEKDARIYRLAMLDYEKGRYASAAEMFEVLTKDAAGTPREILLTCYHQLCLLHSLMPTDTNRTALERARRRMLQRVALIDFIQIPEHKGLNWDDLRQHNITLPGLDKKVNAGALISGPSAYVVFHGQSELRVAAGLDSDPEVLQAIIVRIRDEVTEARG